MPDRYITLVVKADQDVVESMQQQLHDAAERGLQLVLAGELTVTGAWVTDEDPSAEERHLLRLDHDGWTLQHSWDCRLRGQLFACPINRLCGEAEAGPHLREVVRRFGPGIYPGDVGPHGGLRLYEEERRPL